MKFLLIGPQGSGKGTIGKKMSDHFSIPLISSGQLLRDLPEDHPEKEEIVGLMERGELVPQEMVAHILKGETSKESCRNGFILDGWGRTVEDLYYFDPSFDKVIYLKISTETSISRLTSRRTCESCGAVFNIISMPPRIPDACDFCGGTLGQRDDDVEDAVRRRLEIFNTETQDVIELFKKQGNIIEVDGEGTPEEVFQLVLKSLE